MDQQDQPILIEYLTQRDGGSKIPMPNGDGSTTTYHFKPVPGAQDRHLAVVMRSDHQQRFLALPHYRFAGPVSPEQLEAIQNAMGLPSIDRPAIAPETALDTAPDLKQFQTTDSSQDPTSPAPALPTVPPQEDETKDGAGETPKPEKQDDAPPADKTVPVVTPEKEAEETTGTAEHDVRTYEDLKSVPLKDLTRPELELVFEKEAKRKAKSNAKDETLIAIIESERSEK